MRQWLRSHLTYANAMSTLAVFLVLTGGVAYAANTVFSSDIVDNQVYSADVRDDSLTGGGLAAADLQANSVNGPEIRNNQVRSADVRDDTLSGGGLTGADIANNTLGGNDVDESTLGQVPQALLGGVGRSAGNSACDPETPGFLTCAFTTINLPSPARVLVIGTVKAQPEPGADRGIGQCHIATNLGTIATSGLTASGRSLNDKFVPLIGTTFVGAGPMDFGIECNELDDFLTFYDARVAAVALSPN